MPSSGSALCRGGTTGGPGPGLPSGSAPGLRSQAPRSPPVDQGGATQDRDGRVAGPWEAVEPVVAPPPAFCLFSLFIYLFLN
jgi:hypothetical protein